MKEILSVENMRQSDAHTIATEVPSLELMYRVAGKVKGNTTASVFKQLGFEK